MSDPLDIGAFLAQAGEHGQVDSSGEFTVSHQQAARKLARFSLPRSSAWVAKLVQAAVRFPARSVEIKQTLSETFFHLEMDEIPNEDALVAAILSGSTDRGRPLEALALALRAMVEQARLSFLLVADDGHKPPRPIYAGKHYSKLSEKARLDRRFHPRPGLSLTVYHRPLRLDPYDPEELLESLRGHAPILDELRSSCFACPLPLLWQCRLTKGLPPRYDDRGLETKLPWPRWKDRQLDGLLGSRELALSELNRLVLIKGLCQLQHSPACLPMPADFEEKRPSLRTNFRRLRRSYGGSREAQAILLLSHRLDRVQKTETQRWSRLLWINDGVLVQEERLQVPTVVAQLTLLVNASGLTTDLTGFSLVDNDQFRLRREEALRAAGEALAQAPSMEEMLREDRDSLSAQDDLRDAEEASGRKVKRMLKGSGSLLVLTLLNPVLGPPAALGLLLDAFVLRRRAPVDSLLSGEELLRRVLESDLKTLRRFLTAEEPPPPPGRMVEFVSRRL